ncbi:MAG TPA: thiol:disulfide interchange protein DsbA/DsbL [Usitatibacteraceae bacterium]
MFKHKWLKSLMFASLTLLASSAFAQRPTEVVPLNPPLPVENDGKIEVLEFFSYACPHCNHLDPFLETWIKRQPADVKVKRVPMDGINGFNNGAALFYTLEAMGQLDRLHTKIFDAFHVDFLMLANPAVLNKWLEKNGVDPRKFEEVQKSFSVDNKVKRARAMVADYKINSVPTMVVNGRFQVVQLDGPERLFTTLDRLIGDARGPRKVGAAASPAKQ